MRLRKLTTLTAVSVAFGVFAVLTVPGTAKTPIAPQAAEEKEPILVSMSHKSGVYDKAFTLTIDSDGADKIYYTLDGSNPETSDTRIEYEGGIAITERADDENYVSAVDPTLFDSANVKWDRNQKKYISIIDAPDKSSVDKCTVVKAVAIDADGEAGTVETNTYFVGSVADHIQGAKESAKAAGIPLSVVSISTDYANLFDHEKGIFVKGKTYEDELNAYLENHASASTSIARDFLGNYSQKGKTWERPAHVDYFETDGETLDFILGQDCGIRTQGNYSRSDLMKSIRLYAKADYGEKHFKYPFFADAKDDNGEVIEKYKKLVLRNGGNYAFSGTKYNDTYWQSLLSDLDCETQSSRACVVYIDGEYWGLYVLQQDYDDNYFEITHGVDKDNVIVYKASDAAVDKDYGYKLDEGELPDGVDDINYYYNDLLEFFENHENLIKEEDYKAFCELVDPQSVMDYFAVNVWINNKWDWPGKNWSMWRSTVVDEENEYADGRFRFCFYDLDFGGCNGSYDVYANTIAEDNYNTAIDEDGDYYNDKGLLGQNLKEAMNPALQCFILLMSNEGFRESFIQELTDLSTTVFEPDQAVEKLDWFRATYGPLFEQFYARYRHVKAAYTEDIYGTSDWIYNNPDSGYAGYNSLKEFVTNRRKGIQSNINFIEDFYAEYGSSDSEEDSNSGTTPTTPPESTPTVNPGTVPTPTPTPTVSPTPTPTPGSTAGTGTPTKKTINKLTVTAKKNSKVIQVKTIAKAKVTVSLPQKIIVNGKKKVKKVTLTASKKGVVKLKLSGKLKKGMKITVTVKQSGYKTKSKTVKVK